ncbi:sortase domain-containing protein [Streptomyces iconiensis]|uniref:Sortase n=1 Tax=Streptomyces iconiensis TaxID=1384038 RepID=A0ABT6ZYS5_9ACTN|nr:sortase [Streptomyces iconiensis]MDJ1134206.1 sortase [Streptomyces iconiensis]
MRLFRTLCAVCLIATAAIFVPPLMPDASDNDAQRASADAKVTAAPMSPSHPLRVKAADIGVDAKVVQLGRTPDGSIGTPPKSQRNLVGWYRGSVTPGERGSAALVGHVDSDKQRAVFFRLSELRAGHKISVRRADGSTAQFTVDTRKFVEAKNFPYWHVLSRKGGPGLWLITCAPPFDKKTKTYKTTLLVHGNLTETERAAS